MALVYIWILCVKQILVVVCIIVRLLVIALCWNVAQLFGDSVLEVLVMVLVVVLVNCIYFRNTFHSEFTW